ncbi:hypothetical protein B0H14DRAFT_2564430 [Mycena olivaceomarginata]|nr:hypothetical protein B0H14DRAFT_2564430 [Mycena olivaceomarginata]
MPKGRPKRSTAPRGLDGMFLSTRSHPNTSGSSDESDIGALESDSELEQDPDYTEDWEGQPQPTTFEERRKINEEKRARIAAKKRNAEMCSAEHCFAGPANTQKGTGVLHSNRQSRVTHHHARIVEFLKCTVSTAFSARIDHYRGWVQHPSESFINTILVRLGDAVARAEERAKQEIGRNPVEQDSEARVVNGVAEFLSRFALFIHDELKNSQQFADESDEEDHWKGLQKKWMAEVAVLREALKDASPSSVEEGSSFEEGSSEEGSSSEEGPSSEEGST